MEAEEEKNRMNLRLKKLGRKEEKKRNKNKKRKIWNEKLQRKAEEKE